MQTAPQLYLRWKILVRASGLTLLQYGLCYFANEDDMDGKTRSPSLRAKARRQERRRILIIGCSALTPAALGAVVAIAIGRSALPSNPEGAGATSQGGPRSAMIIR